MRRDQLGESLELALFLSPARCGMGMERDTHMKRGALQGSTKI